MGAQKFSDEQHEADVEAISDLLEASELVGKKPEGIGDNFFPEKIRDHFRFEQIYRRAQLAHACASWRHQDSCGIDLSSYREKDDNARPSDFKGCPAYQAAHSQSRNREHTACYVLSCAMARGCEERFAVYAGLACTEVRALLAGCSAARSY